MKIFLGNSPWYKKGFYGVRAGSRWPHFEKNSSGYMPFPFYLAYSAALLKNNGFDVLLVDGIAEKIIVDKFISKLTGFSPEIVLFEVSTPSIKHDIEIAEKVFNLMDHSIKIIFCGLHVFEDDFLKKYNFIHYILEGEYEYNLLNLAVTLSRNGDLSQCPGLTYRINGEIKKNKSEPIIRDLDIFPLPERDSLPMENYCDRPGNIPEPSVQMLSGRGCPFKCIFCAWPQIMYKSNVYRMRDPVKVIDEMEYLVQEKGFKSVYFDDDTFNVNKEHVIAICREKLKRKIDVPWAVMARADLMDKDILEHLKESNLKAVKYGVESSNQVLLDNACKGMDIKKTEEMILFTKKMGIFIHLTFMFGLPGETKDTINRTIDFAAKMDPDSVQFSISTPYKGLKYYDMLKEKGYLLSENTGEYDGYFNSVIRTEKCSRQDLIDAVKKAGMYFDKKDVRNRFFKSKNKSKYLIELLKSPSKIKYLFK